MVKEIKKEEKEQERFVMGTVATKTENVAVDMEEKHDDGQNKTYNVLELCIKIANNQEKLMKLLN